MNGETLPLPPVDAEQHAADLAILEADPRTAGQANRPARLVARVLCEGRLLALLAVGCGSVYWLAEQVDGDVLGALAALVAAGKIVRLSEAMSHGRPAPALDVYGIAKGAR
jgi:hypothetical protein